MGNLHHKYRKVFTDNFGDIPLGFHVHHLDGDRNNNTPDNLIAVSPELHYEIHSMQWERYNSKKDYYSARYLKIELDNPRPLKHPTRKYAKWNSSTHKNKLTLANGNVCLDIETGIFYNSTREMARSLNISRQSNYFKSRCEQLK